MGFEEPVLDFQCLRPLLQPDIELALTNESGEIGRVKPQNLLQGLERFLEPLGAFQVAGQSKQDFDIVLIDAACLSMQPNGFRKILLCPVQAPQPQKRINMIRIERQGPLKETDG